MANKHRGEVDVIIGGKTHAIAFTLDALGRVAGVLGCETMVDVEARLQTFRVADFAPVMIAMLEGNGHQVDAADIGRMNPRAYVDAMIALWAARPAVEEGSAGGAPTARPPKRVA